MAVSFEDIVQGAYGSAGRTGIGSGAGQIDPEGYNFWLDALKAGVVTPDQLLANFNKSVAETIQQQPETVNSQAVASYIAANPLVTQIDPSKVVAAGDSTTWGYNQGNQVAENMVTTAQKALGSDYSVSNLGINSTTAGDFLNSSDFDKVLSSGAGTVVLNYGMNEAYKNIDPATFANNLLTAVQTLQAVGKKVILQTPNATGFSTKAEDAWTQNVGAYADVVRNVAQQTGTTLDDKFSYTSTLKNATSAADIVHPTAETYGLLGNNLADAIKTTTTGVAPTAISVTAPTIKSTGTLATNVQGDIGAGANNLATTSASASTGTTASTASSEDIATKLKNQILSQGTTNQWTGQGLGSPEANAADMAKHMVTAGITDINQFGKVPEYVTVEDTGQKKYNGQFVQPQYNSDTGTFTYGMFKGTGQLDSEGKEEKVFVPVPNDAKLETVYGIPDVGSDSGKQYNLVDTSKLKTVDGQLLAESGRDIFGNKVTGQAIQNKYEVGGNAFGGTSAGTANTGYRVQFTANGTPIFYTAKESSNQLFNLLSGDPLLNAAVNAAAGYLGGPLAVGALQAAQGKDFQDIAKATVLSYLGQQAGQYLSGSAPIDASNMTSAQFNDAIENQLVGEMQRSGLTNAQINQFLENASPADIASIANELPVIGASDTLIVEAAKTPITANALIDVLSQVPTVAVTAKASEKVSSDVLSPVTSILGGATTAIPTIEVTDTRPKQTDSSAPVPLLTSPNVTNPLSAVIPTANTSTTTDLSTSEQLKIAQLALTAAGLLGAGSALSGGSTASSGGTQYPIINVPASWATPPKTSVAAATVLPPINFGDRNLLIGTQWEKFLDPKYGQVPEPIKYSQPSNLSYNDLMNILGSKQGMPSASNLSINDIISGIQNQYGQARTGTVG